MHLVICSPIQFLCILLLKERCVQVQATGLRSQPASGLLKKFQVKSAVMWSGWGQKMKYTKVLKAKQERRACFSQATGQVMNVHWNHSALGANSASHCISRPPCVCPAHEHLGGSHCPPTALPSESRGTW